MLELGAGCGADHQVPGRDFRIRVDAIDASPVRAEIARERCRDLDNVSGIVQGPETTRASIQITISSVIVGVLEYAPVFIYSGRGSPGRLFKFLRNSPEAHWMDNGIPGSGYREQDRTRLPGRAHRRTTPEGHTMASTITRIQDLQLRLPGQNYSELLDRSRDFAHAAFFYCFPDYHYARTILSSTGAEKRISSSTTGSVFLLITPTRMLRKSDVQQIPRGKDAERIRNAQGVCQLVSWS